MRAIALAFLLTSFNSYACWKMEATLSVNQDKVVINQKIDHDETYSFGKGNHIFHVRIPSKFDLPQEARKMKKPHLIEMGVQEKKGITISPISKGMVLVETGKEATMIKQDNETGVVTTFIVKLSEI